MNALGFDVLPSQANFIFTKHPKHSGKKLYEQLKGANILVRHFDNDLIDEYLRITIGTDEEMKRLIKFLKEIL